MRPLPVVLAATAVAGLAACTSAVGRPHPLSGFSAAPSYVIVQRAAHLPRTAQPSSSSSSPSVPVPVSRSATRPRPARPRQVLRAAQLPLAYPTGAARQVLTVVAGATSDTQGVVQAWRRVPGGWRRVGPAVAAELGSDGMTPHPSESLSAVPMGSFTLTHAFGHDPDPGTRLPYLRTTPADWWVSQAGPYYNTERRCAAACPFTQGAPNEHLYYETPFYDYAAVIDYNTRNAPGGVRQGAGSAFFLHVSVGRPTAGCVAVDPVALVRILRWLRPADHPRIVIGTS